MDFPQVLCTTRERIRDAGRTFILVVMPLARHPKPAVPRREEIPHVVAKRSGRGGCGAARSNSGNLRETSLASSGGNRSLASGHAPNCVAYVFSEGDQPGIGGDRVLKQSVQELLKES